ncbi:AarF/ABC1/UbiB kinase family protein [Phaeovibrio sulfidiphilus]|uniref:AarF/ABC1/UbiB kinase family protein n=1 Tax=Phaeovibrio sulfidiphilus TaxID=1220600 RepID=A0A8J6YMH0_9PROT|nr:AarF/UbiB family protein [Phaeovibrio sulfidiphilus]MBE1237160.1 AarF/ABC1/UbiB kinase family protein [Phaeovibrio sulfidiphilus]
MSEGNTFGGRVKRYARVSTSVGGLAVRAAGTRYLGLKKDEARFAQDMRQVLGNLKGPLMKVAQILSTIPDALPSEYVSELAHLQSDAPHMGWPFVKRRMAAELGPDWESRFGSFEREAAAAASLGQVHRATHKDGRQLACKLQYPDMSSVVEADLRQLKVIISLYRKYDGTLDPSLLHAELADRLREELDYAREAKNMRLYTMILENEKDVHIPEPVDDLCTDRLLTMTWLDGNKLLSFKDHDLETRNRIAYNMFRAWYVPFYEYGVIHGDPHLGNYTVRDDLSLNLLDFGAIRVFRPTFVKGVIDLYIALRDNDRDRAVHAYESWGFGNLDMEMIDVLNQWASFVYGPLLENRMRAIRDDLPQGGQVGRKVAEKVHENLKKIGSVTPPREFVLMDRAAIGLGSVFWHLDARINWYEMFHELINDFDVDRLARKQAEVVRAADLEGVLEMDRHEIAAPGAKKSS